MPYTPHESHHSPISQTHLYTNSYSANEQITYPHCAQTSNESQSSNIIFAFFKFLKLHSQEHDPSRRIRHAIAETSKSLDYSQDYVAKVLVDMGLKAPHRAFPHSYIEHLKTYARYNPWSAGALSYAENKIVKSWHLA